MLARPHARDLLEQHERRYISERVRLGERVGAATNPSTQTGVIRYPFAAANIARWRAPFPKNYPKTMYSLHIRDFAGVLNVRPCVLQDWVDGGRDVALVERDCTMWRIRYRGRSGLLGLFALLWTHIRFITGRLSEGSVRGDSGPLGARRPSPGTPPVPADAVLQRLRIS